MADTKRLPITAANSTVLGYGATTITGAKMWSELDWKGVRTDGGKHFINPAGGEYLHVAVKLWPGETKEDRRWYRVRPAYYPGRKFRGREVADVKVCQVGSDWFWELHFKEVSAHA